MTVQGVIFDLGGTLIARERVPDLFYEEANARALWQWLREKDLAIDESFVPALVAERQARFAERMQGTREIRAEAALRPALERYGVRVDVEFLTQAEAAFFEPELTAMHPLPDAIALLARLRGLSLRVGLASNASSHYFVAECCRRLGFTPYLDPIISSALVGWAKPDPRIFNAVLAHWSLPPTSAAMVGDTFNADIAGAHQMGMRTILLTAEHGPQDHVSSEFVRADAVAENLQQVGEIIEGWRREPGG